MIERRVPEISVHIQFEFGTQDTSQVILERMEEKERKEWMEGNK